MTDEKKEFSNPSAVNVPGYKPQSEANLKIVKFHKEWEERTMRHLDWLKAQDGIDQRWLAMGRTSLENGFMQVNRAVMQPGRITLPEDAEPDMLAYNQKPSTMHPKWAYMEETLSKPKS